MERFHEESFTLLQHSRHQETVSFMASALDKLNATNAIKEKVMALYHYQVGIVSREGVGRDGAHRIIFLGTDFCAIFIRRRHLPEWVE